MVPIYVPKLTGRLLLQTDASKLALGGAMYEVLQEAGEEVRYPVRYWSKVLSPCERNWHSNCKEMYGVVYAVRLMAKMIRAVRTCTVMTDNTPSYYHLDRGGEGSMSLNVKARWVRWLTELLEVPNIRWEQVKGVLNTTPDFFSRLIGDLGVNELCDFKACEVCKFTKQ
jgi:hypothetical protein